MEQITEYQYKSDVILKLISGVLCEKTHSERMFSSVNNKLNYNLIIGTYIWVIGLNMADRTLNLESTKIRL